MDFEAQYPSDLARHLMARLFPANRTPLQTRLITELIETAYFASMRTEESSGTTFIISFVEYSLPDAPPVHIRPQRGTLIRFAKEMPYSVKVLVKLAQAADPASTCIAVGATSDGKLRVIGLIDQEIHHRKSVRHVREASGFDRLGIFQLEVTGVGAISAYTGRTMVASLRQGTLATNFVDVFREGPVKELLLPHVDSFRKRVREETGDEFNREHWAGTDDWNSLVKELWTGTLCRTLLAIQRYGHGGALLLQPRHLLTGLNVKYRIDYTKLNDALVLDAVSFIRQERAWWEIHDDHLEAEDALMSPQLFLDHEVSRNNRGDALEAQEGAVDFIGSLSRVDGLILMSNGFRVRGFGVEITLKPDPSKLFIASDAKAEENTLIEADLLHFGTRHRSMIRYCNSKPGSVGFIISQDGEVRAIARRKGKVILWDNVRLLDIEQLSVKRR